jgi:dihydroorotase/N-acyl-D-amino-acid deacylase
MKRLPVVLALLAACSSSNPSTVPTPSGGGYDVVIENGRVVDGTGSAWFYGDIGIRGGRIATIVPRGLLAKATATERVNAAGLVVAPGFIDIQSHSRDAFLDGDGRVVGKITQGITTEIMGEAGTNAPQNQGTGIDPKHDFSGPRGFDKWLTAMKAHGVSPNIGSFVGASTVRMYAKGMAQGAATPAELDTMRAVVRNAMEDGAFGIGSALIYPPGNYASTEELIEINKASAPYGGVYITHMRSEAGRLAPGDRRGAAHRPRRRGAGRDLSLEGGRTAELAQDQHGDRQDRLGARGGTGRAGRHVQLHRGRDGPVRLPSPWASADGKLFSNLKDPATWAKIRAEMDRVQDEWEALCQLATPSGVLVLGLNKPENQKYAGKRLGEIAQAMGKDWEETVRDLLISEEQRIGTVYFMMSEDNVKTKLQQPWMKFGTDAGGSDPDSAKGLTHPRSYGNYPRILGKYVRDEKVMSLEDAIRKMSSAVATRLSIGDRGVLKNGLWADIVVFDPETIADKATFEKPHQLSVGMKYVFVNGVTVVRDGKHTGAKPGMIVRGPGYRAH